MKGITLIVKPTLMCNMKCTYCYEKGVFEHCKNDKMPLETVKKICEVFGDSIKTWIWHGGEPLLMGIDWLDKATQIIKDNNDNTTVSIQTNSTLINEEFIEFFKKYNIRPGISFDGIKNEDTRGNTARIMKAMNLLDYHNIAHGAIMVVTEDTIDNIIDEYEYAKKTGIYMQMNLVMPTYANDNAKELSEDKIVNGIIKFFDYWIKDKIKPTSSRMITSYIDMLIGGNHLFCNNRDCVGKWFGILSNGDIYPCGRDWLNEYDFGNINEMTSAAEILKTPNFINYRKETMEMLNNCATCDFFYNCMGGCFGHAIRNRDGNTLRPDKIYCKSTKKILTYMYNTIKNIDLKDYEEYNPLFIRKLQDSNFRNLDLIKELENKKER